MAEQVVADTCDGFSSSLELVGVQLQLHEWGLALQMMRRRQPAVTASYDFHIFVGSLFVNINTHVIFAVSPPALIVVLNLLD